MSTGIGAGGRAASGAGDGSRPWRLGPAVLVLMVVHAAFFSETLFGGKVLSQVDALLLFEPWASVAPPGFRASNELLLDQSLVVLPWLEFAAERLAAGELPLWNPANYAGQPIGAAPPLALFWPPHWAYFAFPTLYFHAWHGWLRLVFAGTCMLLLLRELGVGRPAALLGAVAFSLCGFNVLWLGHNHTNASIFLPLFPWFVERAAKRPSRRLAAGFAPCTALILLGGHPQTAAHVLLAAGAWTLARTRVALGGARIGARGIGTLVAGGALGILLAMPLVLPFVDYLRVSHGVAVSTKEDLVAEVDPAVAAGFLVAPDRLGHPQDGDYEGPQGPNLNYQELAGVFAGRTALALALAALVMRRRDPRAWLLAGLGAAAALVAWQVPPFHDAMRLLPGVRNTKLLRFVLVTALAVSALAALGLDAIAARLSARPGLARLAALAATLVLAAELFAFGRGYNPAIDPDSETVLPDTPVTRFLEADESLHRVIGTEGSTFAPNANMLYGVHMLTGYDAIEYRTLVELVSRLTSDPRAAVSLKEVRWFDRMLPLAHLLNVKYVLTRSELPPPLELRLDAGLRVYENPSVLPRAFVARDVVVETDPALRLDLLAAPDFDPRIAVLEAPDERAETYVEDPGEVTVESYAPRRVVLAAEMAAPGLVVLSDSFDDDWTARVDGREREIHRVDHHLRGVWVEAGASRIEMLHEPASLPAGFALAGVGAAGVVGLLVLGRRRPFSDRRTAPDPSP